MESIMVLLFTAVIYTRFTHIVIKTDVLTKVYKLYPEPFDIRIVSTWVTVIAMVWLFYLLFSVPEIVIPFMRENSALAYGSIILIPLIIAVDMFMLWVCYKYNLDTNRKTMRIPNIIPCLVYSDRVLRYMVLMIFCVATLSTILRINQ